MVQRNSPHTSTLIANTVTRQPSHYIQGHVETLRETIDYSSKLTEKIFWTNGGCALLIFFLAFANVSHGLLPGSHGAVISNCCPNKTASAHDISGSNLHYLFLSF